MPEYVRISLRKNTKRIVDTIRRFLYGSAGEIRSFRKEQYRRVLSVHQVHQARSRRVGLLILVGDSELALCFFPQSFFAGPDRNLGARGKA